MSQRDEPLWLVKSSGHILGPFSEVKVEELLRTRELVVLDEVAVPNRRWIYIRNEPLFSKIVEELRVKDLKNDDDSTETIGTISDEFTGSLTENIGVEAIDDRTLEITQDIQPLSLNRREEIVYHQIDEELDPLVKPTNINPAKKYVAQGSITHSKSSFTSWLLAILLIAGVVLFLLFNRHYILPKNNQKKSTDYIAQAFESIKMGKNKVALENFEKAYALDDSNVGIYIDMGTLLIQVEGQTVRGKRLLNDVLNFDNANKKYAYTGIGLANLFDAETRFAESNFRQALALDPNYSTALVNMAISSFYKKDYEKSIQLLRSAIVKGVEDNAAFLMLADNYINLWMRDKKKKYLEQAENILTSFHQKYDYRQEAFFLMAYLQFLKGKSADFSRYALKALELDPKLTEDHKHDLLTYRETISWVELSRKCEQIPENFGEDKILNKILHGFCYTKSGQVEAAKKKLNDAINRDPKNPLTQAVYSYFLTATGLNDAATVALGRATELDRNMNYLLPLYLQAWFCQDFKDYDCASDSWLNILKLDPQSLSATVNLAKIRILKGSNVNVYDVIVKSYRKSKHYIPLMELEAMNESFNSK